MAESIANGDREPDSLLLLDFDRHPAKEATDADADAADDNDAGAAADEDVTDEDVLGAANDNRIFPGTFVVGLVVGFVVVVLSVATFPSYLVVDDANSASHYTSAVLADLLYRRSVESMSR